MSDDIRAEAGRKFRSWGIPIDTRKPEKRTEEKWPGGGTVKYLVEGGNGKSPGLAVIGAELTFLLAEHLLAQKKKREQDARTAGAAAAKVSSVACQARTVAAATAIQANVFTKPGSKKRGAAALPLAGASGSGKQTAARSASTTPAAPAAEEHPDFEVIPLESEATRITPEQKRVITDRYGKYLGQRIVSMLLSFDTFRTAWKVGYRRLPVPCDQKLKDDHAFEWFHEWADWTEAIERVANGSFRSWIPHRLLFKGTRQIAEEGDLWVKSTAALEANQAEMGRTLDQVSSRRRHIDQGEERTRTNKMMSKDSDEHRVVEAKVVGGMAMSASRHFIATQAFRGDEENRILQRQSNRLVLGAEARSTAPRTNPKFIRMPVDPNASYVSVYIEKMQPLC